MWHPRISLGLPLQGCLFLFPQQPACGLIMPCCSPSAGRSVQQPVIRQVGSGLMTLFCLSCESELERLLVLHALSSPPFCLPLLVWGPCVGTREVYRNTVVYTLSVKCVCVCERASECVFVRRQWKIHADKCSFTYVFFFICTRLAWANLSLLMYYYSNWGVRMLFINKRVSWNHTFCILKMRLFFYSFKSDNCIFIFFKCFWF